MDFIDKYNLAVGVLITFLSAIFGRYWYLFGAFLVMNVVDFFSGWHKARVKHTETSAAGWIGAVKKVWYWVIVAIAFLSARVFVDLGNDILKIDLNFMYMIGWFTLASLIINEIRSILENLVEIGVEVPEILIKGLAITEKLVSAASDTTVGGEDDNK